MSVDADNQIFFGRDEMSYRGAGTLPPKLSSDWVFAPPLSCEPTPEAPTWFDRVWCADE